jgi:hypothetical protein
VKADALLKICRRGRGVGFRDGVWIEGRIDKAGGAAQRPTQSAGIAEIGTVPRTLPAMFRSNLRFILLLAALAIIAAACSSSDPAASTSTVVDTTMTTLALVTTTVPATTMTTTTTEPPVGISESINGLPADDELIDRRVVGIKIDNHVRARPQYGLELADAVYEVLVEGGITRFIALFHQTDLETVGPNRSGRVTDSKVMAALAGAPFQISGAQGWVKNIYKADDINVVYDTGFTTWRDKTRPKPNNLFTSTLLIREWADERGWPDENPGNLFAYGEPTPGEAEATRIEIYFSDVAPSTWAWDGSQYLRFHGTTPHEWLNEEGETGQVAFDTLVVMKMRKYIASNPAGSGTSLPTVDTVGKGEALVFYSGQVVGGTWERGSITDPFFLSTADGKEIVLPAGRVWISLQPDNRNVIWE